MLYSHPHFWCTMTVPSQLHLHAMRRLTASEQCCHISLKMVPKNLLVLHRGHFHQLKNIFSIRQGSPCDHFWNQEIS